MCVGSVLTILFRVLMWVTAVVVFTAKAQSVSAYALPHDSTGPAYASRAPPALLLARADNSWASAAPTCLTSLLSALSMPWASPSLRGRNFAPPTTQNRRTRRFFFFAIRCPFPVARGVVIDLCALRIVRLLPEKYGTGILPYHCLCPSHAPLMPPPPFLCTPYAHPPHAHSSRPLPTCTAPCCYLCAWLLAAQRDPGAGRVHRCTRDAGEAPQAATTDMRGGAPVPPRGC